MYNYCPRGHRNSYDVVSNCSVCGAKMDGPPSKPPKKIIAREIEDDDVEDVDPDYEEFLRFKANKAKNKNRVTQAVQESNEDDSVEIPDVEKLTVEIIPDRTPKVSLADAMRAAQPPMGARTPPPKVKPKAFLKEFLKQSESIQKDKGPTVHSVPTSSK